MVSYCSLGAGKHMLESRGGVAGQPVPEGGFKANPRGNGKIINISSLVAFQGGLNVVAYAAAKHGVQGIVSRTPSSGASELTTRLHRSKPSPTAGQARASTSTVSHQATSLPTYGPFS